MLDAAAAAHGDSGAAQTLAAFLQRVTGSSEPDAAMLLAHVRASIDDLVQQVNLCVALLQVIQRDALLACADEVVAAVVAAMNAHCDFAPLQHFGCAVIAHVPLGVHGHSAEGAARAVDAVLAAMRAHPSDAPLQQACCTALGSIVVQSEVNTIGAVAAGAVPAVVSTMLAHRTYVDVQSRGCDALGCLYHFSCGDDLATNCGAVHALVSALNAHPGSARVQAFGCKALGNVLAAGNDATAALRINAFELGAVKAVVAALRAHPAHAGVAHGGCLALRHLACDHSHEPSRREAEHAGAIDAVTAAMRAHLHDADVQCEGCIALLSALNSYLRAAGCTVIDAVLAAMRAHPTNTDIQMHGCIALTLTVANDDGNRRAAIAAGAIEAVVATLALCPQLPLYKMAWSSLSWLSRNCEASHDRAVRAGALDALTAAVELPEDVANAPGHVELIAHLRAAAKRHDDAAACEHAAECTRCAALRARGERCALPGCGARRREGAANKTLLLCAACRGAARYCGPAHQRADWARHKPACRLSAEESDEDDATCEKEEQ